MTLPGDVSFASLPPLTILGRIVVRDVAVIVAVPVVPAACEAGAALDSLGAGLLAVVGRLLMVVGGSLTGVGRLLAVEGGSLALVTGEATTAKITASELGYGNTESRSIHNIPSLLGDTYSRGFKVSGHASLSVETPTEGATDSGAVPVRELTAGGLDTVGTTSVPVGTEMVGVTKDPVGDIEVPS